MAHKISTDEHCTYVDVWMENKAVTMPSTARDQTKMSADSRTQKGGTKMTVTCLEVVATYNQIMGGIDKFDQLRERYAIGRRALKRWHGILYFLVDLSIVNAFVWYNIVGLQKKDQLSFRLKLARQLICGHM